MSAYAKKRIDREALRSDVFTNGGRIAEVLGAW